MSDKREQSEKSRTPEDRVLGIVHGDRVCVSCGFNLSGQRIVREEKYNLLIARCPECGQVAPLMEYPLLGRWANRWAATLAGLWLLLFFAASFACGMTIFGLAMGTTEVVSDEAGIAISDAHRAWALEHNPDLDLQQTRWDVVDPSWWDGADKRALFNDAGGVRMIVWRGSQTTWIGLFFAMVAFGSAGSIMLLGVPKARLALATLFPLAIASAASLVMISAGPSGMSSHSSHIYVLARELVRPWTIPMTIALGGVFLVVGLLIGRPLARWLARTALPNRFVQGLSALWTCEGKSPPRPRRPHGP